MPFSEPLTTVDFVTFVDCAGALASATVEYACWLFLPLDNWYIFGAFSTCELSALLVLLEAKRLYT